MKDRCDSTGGKAEAGVSVVIPSWNGRGLLDKCLPTVRAALDRWGGASECIVVDDAGSDGTPAYVADKFPWARVEIMPARRGFVHAANRGMRTARFEFVLMLNNDMEIGEDFIAPLVERLGDARVFAVSARAVQTGTGALNIGRRVRRIVDNQVVGAGSELDAPVAGYTLFASGGASLFRRSAALELGCFDEMYAPFYTEDTDLSYRAWKRGMVVLYEPRSTALHVGGASITKKGAAPHVRFFTRLRVGSIIHRNAVLFYTKNFTSPALWAAYRKNIIVWTLLSPFQGRVTWLLGLLMSLPRLPRAVAARKTEIKQATLNDFEVYELLNREYRPEERA